VTALTWRRGRTCAVAPDDSEVWLFGGAGPTRLSGGPVGCIARGVDGKRTREHLVDQGVLGGLTRERATLVIDRWIAAGHLCPTELVDASSAWTSHVESQALEAALAAALGHDAHAEVFEYPVDPAGVRVMVVDDLLDAERAVQEVGSAPPVRLVQVRGDRVLVTAPVGPGGLCATCLVRRRTERLAPEFLAASRVGLAQPPALPLAHHDAVRYAATHVLSDSAVAGIVAIDPESGEQAEHILVPIPGCPTCDPGGRSAMWSHLDDVESSAPTVLLDDPGLVGSRTVEPNRTWESHRHLVSDLIGIVPIIEPIGPAELNAFAAGANIIGIHDPAIAASALRNRGGGKGLTREAARASALAEAIERDAMRARGDEPTLHGRMDEIPGAMHPNEIQLFSQRQLDESTKRWDEGKQIMRGQHIMPRHFDPNRPRQWSAVRSLVTGETKYLPTSKIFVRAHLELDDPFASSNGAAAGNTLAEAQLQGLLELIERDSVALWWYPMSIRRRIDLDSWDDPRVTAAYAPHRNHGETWVLDLTSDIGIPATVAISLDDRIPFPILGAGAHVDPAVAVTRSLSEAAQMKASVLCGPAVDLATLTPDELKQLLPRDVVDLPWLRGSGTAAIPDPPSYHNVEEARDDVVARLAAAGHDVMWADLTRRDSRLPVARTFAPGLRHFWRRLAPGRLYDVPSQQGWISHILDEDGVNPLDMPI